MQSVELFGRVFKEKLVLASTSSRRAEILRAVAWPFEAMAAGVDERRLPSEPPVCTVTRLAKAKADAVAERLSAGLVLARTPLSSRPANCWANPETRKMRAECSDF